MADFTPPYQGQLKQIALMRWLSPRPADCRFMIDWWYWCERECCLLPMSAKTKNDKRESGRSSGTKRGTIGLPSVENCLSLSISGCGNHINSEAVLVSLWWSLTFCTLWERGFTDDWGPSAQSASNLCGGHHSKVQAQAAHVQNHYIIPTSASLRNWDLLGESSSLTFSHASTV